ncbi:glycine, alanine and asparagine-rich protein-like [Hylaeus anthracinus]|uniref:glycine, alanine and asparagine-rich protein-like n=1 Tax=Hylaeus anthracinus TaxID=313031 RepID=UPI0023B9C06B|nr:glycine, alanine and asparagine-rich protein-like [Hylaeus anthracinus]
MKFFVFLSLLAAATLVASLPLGGEATNSLSDGAVYREDGEAASEVTRMKKHLHTYKTKSDSSSISLQTPLTNIAIQKSRVRTRPLHLHQPLRHLIRDRAEYLHSMSFGNEDAAAATNAETASAANGGTTAAANANFIAVANANAIANAGSRILVNGVPLYPGQVIFLGSSCPIFGTSAFETLGNSVNVGGPSGFYTKTGVTATAEGSNNGKNTVAEGHSQSASRVAGTESASKSYTRTSATATAEGSNNGKNTVAEGHSQSGSRVAGTESASESYTRTSATATAEGSSYGKNTVAEGHSQSGSSFQEFGFFSGAKVDTSANADVFSRPGIGRTGLGFGSQRTGLTEANAKSNAIAITGNNGFGGNGVAGE